MSTYTHYHKDYYKRNKEKIKERAIVFQYLKRRRENKPKRISKKALTKG